MFALIACPGTPKEKAEIMFDTVHGPLDSNATKEEIEHQQLTWTNSKLFRAFKQLVYFSVVFPKEHFDFYDNNFQILIQTV